MTDPAGTPPAPGAQPRGPGLSALVGRGWRSASQRVISLTALGMVFGLLVDVLTAARFGTDDQADALIVALTIPLLIDTIMREGTKFSLIALFLERRSALSEADFHRFVSGCINLALVIGGSVSLLLMLLAPLVTSTIGPGLPAFAREQAATLLRLAAPCILFAPAGTILGVYLNSQRLFTPVALRNAIAPGIVVIAFGLAWKRIDVVSWVASAYVLGFASYFLTLYLSASRTGYRHVWGAWPRRGDMSALWQAGSLPTLGFGVRQLARLAERGLASLGPPGSVAAYYFAFRVFSACQTIIGTSLATTGLPRMAEIDLSGQRDRMGRVIRRSLMRAFALGGIAAVTFILFRSPIVHLVYARGAMGSEAVERITGLFLWFGIGIPFFSAVPVLQSGIYAQRDYGAVLANMVRMGVLNVALALALFPLLGLAGVALAASLTALASNVSLYRMLEARGVSVFERGRKASA